MIPGDREGLEERKETFTLEDEVGVGKIYLRQTVERIPFNLALIYFTFI